MKRVLFIAIFTTLVIVLYISGLAMVVEKVELCHNPPGNPGYWHTISINENVVPTHLAHGDLMGRCDEETNCAILCDDGNPCTLDSCDDSGGCAAKQPVECDDGLACTRDFCDAATGGCDYVESCPSGQECGYQTGECVECPTEARARIAASTIIHVAMRFADIPNSYGCLIFNCNPFEHNPTDDYEVLWHQCSAVDIFIPPDGRHTYFSSLLKLSYNSNDDRYVLEHAYTDISHMINNPIQYIVGDLEPLTLTYEQARVCARMAAEEITNLTQRPCDVE